MQPRVDIPADCWSVDLQKIDLWLSHEVQYAVAECFKVIFSGLVSALVGPDWGIFDCSEEWLALILDVKIFLINIRVHSTEIR